jgi:hypothetical protein
MRPDDDDDHGEVDAVPRLYVTFVGSVLEAGDTGTEATIYKETFGPFAAAQLVHREGSGLRLRVTSLPTNPGADMAEEVHLATWKNGRWLLRRVEGEAGEREYSTVNIHQKGTTLWG